MWLTQNNLHYKGVEINVQALDSLPVNGIPSDLLTVEADVGPPTDNPSEDTVYDESTEMSSFLPVGEHNNRD